MPSVDPLMLVAVSFSRCRISLLLQCVLCFFFFFFFQAEDGIRDLTVTGVQTCALPIFFAGSSAIALCQRRFADDPAKSFFLYDGTCFTDRAGMFTADLALSL